MYQKIFIDPFINLLVLIYHGLIAIHIPYAFGFSIIVMTALVKITLYPLVTAQLKASKKMQDIQPEMNKLREKYKGDAKRQQLEMMALYKEKGVNPAAGCLPTLIQFPFLIGIYSSIFQVVGFKTVDQINSVLYTKQLYLQQMWDTNFFGLPLTKKPSELLSTMAAVVIILIVITAGLQLIQSKMMASATPPPVEKKQENDLDFAGVMQKQMLYFLPLMIGYFAFILPSGLSLYWNTYTIFGIIQQYRISGLGGLEGWLKKFRK